MRHPDLAYTSPDTFSLKQRAALALLPPAVAWAFRSIYATCRVEVRDREHWHAVSDGGGHYLLALWHESMALAARFYMGSGFHGLTSYGFDGEMAARVLKQFKLGAVRGSSSRGGLRALVALQKAAERIQMVGLTLDGPRGPRREAKAGLAIIATRAQLPILPQAFVAQSCWRLRSWDRLPIPKPFTRIITAYAPPIPPPAEKTREAFEDLRFKVEQELNRLQRGLEEEFRIDPRFEHPAAEEASPPD